MVVQTLYAVRAAFCADQQNAVMEAAKIAMAKNQEVAQQKDDEARALLESENCDIVDVEDKAPWQEACSAIVGDYTQGELGDLYQKILALA